MIPLIIITVWSIYAGYCYSQYTDIKHTNGFIAIALAYGILNNLLWVYVSKKLSQVETLKYALIWDSGIHFTAFLVPLLLFGNSLKPHIIVAMLLIFTGVCIIMFYEHIMR